MRCLPSSVVIFVSYEGIGKGHWGLRDFSSETYVELTQEDDEFSEGKILLKKHLQRERNVKLIEIAKKKFIEKHKKLIMEILRFLLVGGIATVIDFGIYELCRFLLFKGLENNLNLILSTTLSS